MKLKLSAEALIVASILISVATVRLPIANAFTVSGNDGSAQGWANPEIAFLLNTSNCPASVDMVGLLEESIKIWNNVPTSNIKLSYGGTTTNTSDSNPPTIYCTSDMTPFAGAGSNATVIGVGRGNRAVLGGPIVSGLVIMNASGAAGSIERKSDTERKVVMAHEIGHALGIGHSQDSSALMWSDASLKSNFLLSQDDIDALTYFYPRDELSDDKLMGCGLLKSSTQPPLGPGGFAVLALFALPFLLAFGLRLALVKSPKLNHVIQSMARLRS